MSQHSTTKIQRISRREVKLTVRAIALQSQLTEKEVYSQLWHSGLALPNGNRLQAFIHQNEKCYRVVNFNQKGN
jgi:hypothetical protein